jgi:site-specific recombinase XerD
MLRAAELVKIRLEDVHESGGGLAVRMRPSKADQNAMRKPIFIDPTGSPTCPAALTRTLISMRRAQGALESDTVFSDAAGRVLSTSAVSSIVKSVIEHSGFEGNYSGHSLRIGGASAALAAGYSVDEVMALGAWKSEAVKQYLLPLVTRNRNVSKSFGL